ncbi:hypothetical protein C7M52_00050 [Mixta theicola]|nr:DUF3850 domain-containing protein [Mixta theicola]QHM74129.1 hypothetical protein C7M52_00050 [Mixta theicola]
MILRIHQLKIAPVYFNAVVTGEKKAELRRDDRGYKVGDVLSLCEWNHDGKYTGKVCAAVITHMLPVNDILPMPGNWIPGHWVMLSIRPLTPAETLAYVLTGGAEWLPF